MSTALTSVPNRVLIRTPNFIGDTIQMLPTLAIMADENPSIRFIIACPNSVAPVFRGIANVEQIIPTSYQTERSFASFRKFVAAVRQANVDVAFCFQKTLRDAVLLRWARVPHRVGYKKESSQLFHSFTLPPDRHRHGIAQYAYLAYKFFDWPNKKLPDVTLNVGGESVLKPSERIQVGAYFGSQRKEWRAYPVPLVENLLATLHQQSPEKFEFYLLGSPDESAHNDKIVNATTAHGVRCINLAGKTTVAQLIDTIADCKALLLVDSGPMHIAAVLGIPFVGIIGRSENGWANYLPRQGRGVFIEGDNCWVDDKVQIAEVAPEDVVNALNQLLDDSY